MIKSLYINIYETHDIFMYICNIFIYYLENIWICGVIEYLHPQLYQIL